MPHEDCTYVYTVQVQGMSRRYTVYVFTSVHRRIGGCGGAGGEVDGEPGTNNNKLAYSHQKKVGAKGKIIKRQAKKYQRINDKYQRRISLSLVVN